MRHKITHYEALGVSRDASLDEIRAAFRKLAFESHPDRFQGEARRRAEERFQEVTEAFNVLNRPDSRERYDRELAQGGVTSQNMDRAEIARRLAAKGAQELREGRMTEALETLRHAIDHDDQCARAHYFMGVALSRAVGRERDALRHMERALAAEPNNSAMKGEGAALALRVGLRSRAERLARETLDLDPTNVRAQAVLQEIDGEGSTGESGDGLLGRLRRKG